MKACPQCGATDWHDVTEHRQVIFKACGNCKYAPSLEVAESQSASEWVEAIHQEHLELEKEAHIREQELHDTRKPTTLMHGRLNKTKRLLAAADLKMHIAACLSEIVQDTESGQITLLIPELGLYQFEWGDFNLFQGIDKVRREA